MARSRSHLNILGSCPPASKSTPVFMRTPFMQPSMPAFGPEIDSGRRVLRLFLGRHIEVSWIRTADISWMQTSLAASRPQGMRNAAYWTCGSNAAHVERHGPLDPRRGSRAHRLHVRLERLDGLSQPSTPVDGRNPAPPCALSSFLRILTFPSTP